MAAIDPTMWTFQDEYWPVVVCRTFPIRVAGNSGPLNHETTWEALAGATDGYIQPERTTVTKKVRRVGRWDQQLVDRAMRANGGHFAQMAVTFADYLDPSIAGMTNIDEIYDKSEPVREFLNSQRHDILCVTTGPKTIAWA
jgi:adenylosuccinate synthase